MSACASHQPHDNDPHFMTRPNIIFIVADDLGYADLGCYGGRDADFGPVSPVLDRLAANGLRLTQGYANSPVCSPTRFALATARYQYRLRGAAEEPINSKTRGTPLGAKLGLPPEIPTVASLLKGAGYRTALIGKWHLGYPPHFGPLRSGYEEYFGPMSGGVDYFTHLSSSGQHDLWVGEEEHHDEGYLTDLLSQRSVDFVNRMSEGNAPFFLSLHYTAPHWPWETRDDRETAEQLGAGITHLAGGNIHQYRRMIHHMDEGIGWIVEALRKNGQLDNTLIVFTSDNGGERFSDSWPLVGGKMDLTEGGIRVPWIAHWPAVIEAHRSSAQPCMSMDWSATVLDAAGVSADPTTRWTASPCCPCCAPTVRSLPGRCTGACSTATSARCAKANGNTCAWKTTNTCSIWRRTSASVPIWPASTPSACRPCASAGTTGMPACPPLPRMRATAWSTP
jgi:arylsulfatase A-like enzyme